MTDKPNCPDFILAETTDGLVLSYRGDEFTIDDEMRKDLREYLMAPVIKELKHKQANAMGEISHKYLEQDTYREGIIKTCREAISLIRGDWK